MDLKTLAFCLIALLFSNTAISQTEPIDHSGYQTAYLNSRVTHVDWHKNPTAEEIRLIKKYLTGQNISVEPDILNIPDILEIRRIFYKNHAWAEPEDLAFNLQQTILNQRLLDDNESVPPQLTKDLKLELLNLLAARPALIPIDYQETISEFERDLILNLLVKLKLIPSKNLDLPDEVQQLISIKERLYMHGQYLLYSPMTFAEKDANHIKISLAREFDFLEITPLNLMAERDLLTEFSTDLLSKAPFLNTPKASDTLNIETEMMDQLPWDELISSAIEPSSIQIDAQSEEVVLMDDFEIPLFFFVGEIDLPPTSAPPPGSALRWDPASGPIIVCIQDRKRSADTTDIYYEEMFAIIRNAALAWENVSGVEINVSPFSECEDQSNSTIINSDDEGDDDDELSQHLVTGHIERNAGALAAADHLGNRLDGSGALTFKSEYLFNDRICGLRGTHGRNKCRYADALHEFGHLLGFSHDHIGINSPDCEGKRISGETIDMEMTYYDPNSIMNYCNRVRWDGRLSAGDICSVQVAYPKHGFVQPLESTCYETAKVAALIDANRL